MAEMYTAKELASFVREQEDALKEMEEWRVMMFRRNDIIKRAAIAGFSANEITGLMGIGGSATVYTAMRRMGLESLIGRSSRRKPIGIALAIARNRNDRLNGRGGDA